MPSVDQGNIAEIMTAFVPEVIGQRKVNYLGGAFQLDILGFRDTDGSTTYIDRYYEANEDQIIPWFERNGQIHPREFTYDQMDRFSRCLFQYKLPSIVATHLTFNRPDFDLNLLGNPGDKDTPILIGLYGESGAGKSTFAAVMAFKEKVPVVSFDPFSASVPSQDILQSLQESGLTPESDIKDICDSIIEQPRSPNLSSKKNFSDALDRLTEVFLNGNRPEFIFIDFPGIDPSSPNRVFDIFDIAAFYTIPSIFVSRDKQKPLFQAIKDYYQIHWPDIYKKTLEFNESSKIIFTHYLRQIDQPV